jgi:hypothetical protein
MGFLLESPVQLADSQGPYLSTPKGALHSATDLLDAWERYLPSQEAQQAQQVQPSTGQISTSSDIEPGKSGRLRESAQQYHSQEAGERPTSCPLG